MPSLALSNIWQTTNSEVVDDHLRYSLANDNQLIGTIPAELGQLSGLLWLYLGDNQLTGTIPGELQGLHVTGTPYPGAKRPRRGAGRDY